MLEMLIKGVTCHQSSTIVICWLQRAPRNNSNRWLVRD